MMKKRVHVFYSGRVQGVGFRMTAEEIARQFGVVGWVKNLREGRVELIGEAEEDTLKQFLEAVRASPMKNFIQQVDLTWSSASETFDDFEIRYY
ncbi:MAG: acylphosphatase [Candidatus Omnitrophica bacterium]|nr:acylphosphatase [Candidatus Omnitrophota bacterium]